MSFQTIPITGPGTFLRLFRFLSTVSSSYKSTYNKKKISSVLFTFALFTFARSEVKQPMRCHFCHTPRFWLDFFHFLVLRPWNDTERSFYLILSLIDCWFISSTMTPHLPIRISTKSIQPITKLESRSATFFYNCWSVKFLFQTDHVDLFFPFNEVQTDFYNGNLQTFCSI